MVRRWVCVLLLGLLAKIKCRRWVCAGRTSDPVSRVHAESWPPHFQGARQHGLGSSANEILLEPLRSM